MLPFPSTNRDAVRPGERGQSMVETAMVLPVFILIVMAALQLGVVFVQYQQVAFAASEGARCAAVAGNVPLAQPACAPTATTTEEAARVAARKRVASINLSDAQIEVTSASGFAYPGTVSVRVSYPQRIAIIGYDFTVTAQSTARLEK